MADDAPAAVESALADASAVVADVVATLTSADARDELLVDRVQPRPLLGIPRSERLAIRTRVWRLGVLLVDREGALHATGTIIRASDPGHSALQSRLATERRELRVLAQRAGIHDGETLNLDTAPVSLRPGELAHPLVLGEVGGVPTVLVRWTPHSASAPIPLGTYLRERAELLAHPPQGAT